MSNYVLISFYPVDRDNGKRVWLTYGWISTGYNNELGEFETRQGAIDFCFAFGVPVMQGSNVYHIVEKLSE